MVNFVSSVNGLRISPCKLQQVVSAFWSVAKRDNVSEKKDAQNKKNDIPNLAKLIASLEFSGKRGGKYLAKALKAALANAENNHNANIDKLAVIKIFVTKAHSFRRMSPRARGRSATIKKTFSNLHIELMVI